MNRLILISLFYFFIVTNALANENYILLQNFNKISDNKIIFMRHALAPGNGDPSNFNIEDCSTQRNLDAKGIMQSQKLGETFRKYEIKFSKVFSSFWCRCKDTASFLNMGTFYTHNGLNSFYQGYANRDKTLAELNKLTSSLKVLKGTYLMVTHYVVIQAFTGISLPSGGMVVYDMDTEKSYRLKLKD
jgi:phosphohistidine phosphatase SixA